MRRTTRIIAAALAALSAAAACSRDRTDRAGSADASPAAPERDTRFDQALLKIAAEYKGWVRVSNQANWAPSDCRIPPPVGARISASADNATHGRKLYYVFAKDAAAYYGLNFWFDPKPVSPIGQAVVKEAFRPVPVPEAQAPEMLRSEFGHRVLPDNYARGGDGALYRAGEPAGLYIMMKLEPQTAGTDEGWVYAVTTPDAKAIIAAGNLSNCRDCHARDTEDRLYGARPLR